MEAERAARFGYLMLAALLTGNELGSWAAVHPALGTLEPQHRLLAEQAVYRRYGRIMPVLMTATLASAVGGSPPISQPPLAGISPHQRQRSLLWRHVGNHTHQEHPDKPQAAFSPRSPRELRRACPIA